MIFESSLTIDKGNFLFLLLRFLLKFRLETEFDTIDSGVGMVKIIEAPDEIDAKEPEDITDADAGFDIWGITQRINVGWEAIEALALRRIIFGTEPAIQYFGRQEFSPFEKLNQWNLVQ
jgi:hypothetical protein